MLILTSSLLFHSFGVQIGYILNYFNHRIPNKEAERTMRDTDDVTQGDFYKQMKSQFDTENNQVNLRRAIKPIS